MGSNSVGGTTDDEEKKRSDSVDASATYITTDVVSSSKRAEFWLDVVSKNFVDIEIVSEVPSDFSANLLSRQIGNLRVSEVTAGAHAVRSGYKPSDMPRENCLYATLMLEGGGYLQQDGKEVYLPPGDFAFYDATRPHALNFDKGVKMMLVHIPLNLLQSQIAGVEQCTIRCIDGKTGVGAVTATFMRSLSSHLPEMDKSSYGHLAECTFDLLVSSLSSLMPEASPLSKSRALSLQRVKAFVEQHLADPELSITAVSLGVGLSARYINKLFEDAHSSWSLSRYILGRRLERCRQDLGNLAFQRQHISEIALRWGFNDFSHFSRTFKACFNMSPREYREQALGRNSNPPR